MGEECTKCHDVRWYWYETKVHVRAGPLRTRHLCEKCNCHCLCPSCKARTLMTSCVDDDHRHIGLYAGNCRICGGVLAVSLAEWLNDYRGLRRQPQPQGDDADEGE